MSKSACTEIIEKLVQANDKLYHVRRQTLIRDYLRERNTLDDFFEMNQYDNSHSKDLSYEYFSKKNSKSFVHDEKKENVWLKFTDFLTMEENNLFLNRPIYDLICRIDHFIDKKRTSWLQHCKQACQSQNFKMIETFISSNMDDNLFQFYKNYRSNEAVISSLK